VPEQVIHVHHLQTGDPFVTDAHITSNCNSDYMVWHKVTVTKEVASGEYLSLVWSV
jgi:hypothetical protein